MKLVIAGSTGFVGTELVRQALLHPRITSVVALARRETPIPQGVDETEAKKKLTSVVCEDFGTYSEATKKAFEGAGGCIWTVAVTPSKLKDYSWEVTCRTCRDYALKALETLSEANHTTTTDRPLRYIYMSGIHSKRDRAEAEKVKILADNPLFLDYSVMRGQTELECFEIGRQSNPKVEVCATQPGLIQSSARPRREMPGIPDIEIEEVAAAQLDQILNGFESDTLKHEDLLRIGRKALAANAS